MFEIRNFNKNQNEWNVKKINDNSEYKKNIAGC